MLVKGGGNFASGVNVHTIFAVLCHFARKTTESPISSDVKWLPRRPSPVLLFAAQSVAAAFHLDLLLDLHLESHHAKRGKGKRGREFGRYFV
jgi:hypothetical protein